MDYLASQTYSHNQEDITRRLKARAGQIISQTLTIDHVPQRARGLMANPVVHSVVRLIFRDVIVDCLAAYFDRLEESRAEVLDEVVRRTKSRHGTRLRLVESAIQRMNNSPHYDILNDLERRVTPELYSQVIAVVRYEYAKA